MVSEIIQPSSPLVFVKYAIFAALRSSTDFFALIHVRSTSKLRLSNPAPESYIRPTQNISAKDVKLRLTNIAIPYTHANITQ